MERKVDWKGALVNASLKPNPGSEGQTMWYACPPSAGAVRWAKSGAWEMLVKGKLGMTRSGMAEGELERMCIKWMRSDTWGAGSGGVMARRNWGSSALYFASCARQS